MHVGLSRDFFIIFSKYSFPSVHRITLTQLIDSQVDLFYPRFDLYDIIYQ
jgi:hypothetical protein